MTDIFTQKNCTFVYCPNPDSCRADGSCLQPNSVKSDGQIRDPERVPSSNDKRTMNNSVRSTYRKLTDQEKAQVDSIKELGAMMIALCHEIGGTDPNSERLGSRDLSLAVTHIEDGVMRSVRHVTK